MEKTIQRYIWLSRLLPELLEFVDAGRLGFSQGVDISFLTEEQQAWVLLVIKRDEVSITTKQSLELKKYSQENKETFSCEDVLRILSEKKHLIESFL